MKNQPETGWRVVLKFHYGRRGSVNPIISHTMGRVAVISHAYQGAMPQPGTFWLCEIEREISSDQDESGCYIVNPVCHVPLEKIMKLVPGTYETEIRDKKVICRPKVKEHYWIIPFSIKKFFIKKDKAKIQYQSIIVPIEITIP